MIGRVLFSIKAKIMFSSKHTIAIFVIFMKFFIPSGNKSDKRMPDNQY